MKFNPHQWDCFSLVFLLAVLSVPVDTPAGGYFGDITIILQPVPPKTIPSTDYPPGTDIIDQEIILGSVPARVWLDVFVTGEDLNYSQTVGASLSATGGFIDAETDCNGDPLEVAERLFPAFAPCDLTSDCRESISGTNYACCVGPTCGVFSGTRCTWSPEFYHYDGQICEPVFQDRCRPDWIAPEGILFLPTIAVYGLFFAASSIYPNALDDFQPSYLGTIVLDVPSDAKGSYVLEVSGFANGLCPPQVICERYWLFSSVATVTVLCGRCCYDLGGEDAQCVDHVSANECAAYGVGAVFQANEVCPEQGGPACPECGLDEHCDDGQYCNGVEVCEANSCGPGTPPCEPYEECEEATDSCSPRIPALSAWGLVILGLFLLLIAKLRWNGTPDRALE